MAEEKKGGSKGAMTVSEAGRKGGVRVRETRGRKFYEEIGKKGGETIKAERGTPFYEEIGRKGGHKVRELIEKGKAGGEEEAGKGEGMGDDR
jgi:general stress protein YciG